MGDDKDLDVKIGTKEEAFWTKIKDQSEALVENCTNEILLHSEIKAIAEKKIVEEQKKAKA